MRIENRAFLFPGQGAQTLGMAADLVEAYPAAKRVFADAEGLLGTDFLAVCRTGPEAELNSTRVSQPAIFLHSMAVLDVLASQGLSSERFCVGLDAVGTAGLSLGEYSALVFAGSLTFEDALRVVARRGEYMQEACDATQGAMASILALPAPEVEKVVEQARAEGLQVGVANYNSPGQTVISGEKAAVEATMEKLREAGARRAVQLRVAGAYHSELMASATTQLRPLLEELKILPPRVPFYCNVTGKRATDPEEIRRGLIAQVESSVRWEQSLVSLVDAGMQGAYELGPGRVLAGLMKSVAKGVSVVSLGTQEKLSELTEPELRHE